MVMVNPLYLPFSLSHNQFSFNPVLGESQQSMALRVLGTGSIARKRCHES
jgi:hypothetical protein